MQGKNVGREGKERGREGKEREREGKERESEGKERGGKVRRGREGKLGSKNCVGRGRCVPFLKAIKVYRGIV